MRESPDLFSGGMCLSQIRSGMLPVNSIHVLLHRHLSVVALCYLIKIGGILRRHLSAS